MSLNPLLKGLLQKTNQGFQAADDFLGSRGGNFALNLLAQQGYSTMPQSPVAAIGRAGLATQAQQSENAMNAAQRRLIESQIGLNEARINRANDRNGQDRIGRVSPGQYTPESLAEFARTGDFNSLEFRQPDVPSSVREFEFFSGLTEDQQEDYLDVQRGSPVLNVPGAGIVRPDQSTSDLETLVPEPVVEQGTEDRARAGAVGAAEGAAIGDQSSKAPVMASFNVAADNMLRAIEGTPQGGFMGAVGYGGGFTDFQAVQDFNNAVQQLSTELRTVFRIPGEGQLSDREQEQYNLQLPNTRFDRETNENIIATLRARIEARLSTPIDGDQEDIDAIANQYLGE